VAKEALMLDECANIVFFRLLSWLKLCRVLKINRNVPALHTDVPVSIGLVLRLQVIWQKCTAVLLQQA